MSGIGWKSSLQRPAAPGRHGTPQERAAARRFMAPLPKTSRSVPGAPLDPEGQRLRRKPGSGYQAAPGAWQGRNKPNVSSS
jgi:hypothetical protein